MAISLEVIQKLREQTMAPMSDVKKALEEANGDEQQALFLLRKRGKVVADKKADRETKAGFIAHYTHRDGRIGVLLELKCETDFVAKNTEFQALAKELAMHVAAMNPKWVKPADVPSEAVEAEKKLFAEQVKDMKKPADVIGQIIEGKLKKYYDEVCLLNQTFVKEDRTVSDLIAEYVGKIGENIEVGRFARFEI